MRLDQNTLGQNKIMIGNWGISHLMNSKNEKN